MRVKPCSGIVDIYSHMIVIRDGFEPYFCGLESGRVLEMRARVGLGQYICEL